ncbi:MAG TPA: hypothetical protein VD994_02395 [Prosthecobacter sp.]|nr:hypothetical protein [Prosthecobacter sp.]
MTVKELIEALQKMPPDREVKVWDSEWGWMEIETLLKLDDVVELVLI